MNAFASNTEASRDAMLYCYFALLLIVIVENKLDLLVAAVRDAEFRFLIHFRIHLQCRLDYQSIEKWEKWMSE